MKSKLLSPVTVFVGAVLIMVAIASVTIPSLLRARVSYAPPPQSPLEAYRKAPPATYSAPLARAEAEVGSTLSTGDTLAKLAFREWRDRPMHTENYARIRD